MTDDKSKQNLIPADKRLRAQKNFTRVPNEIIEHNELSMQAKVIWIEMWKFYFEYEGKDGQDGEIFPGMQTISDQLNCSPTTARKYRKELEEKGLLKTVQRGRGKTNVYYLYTANTPERQMGDDLERQMDDDLERQMDDDLEPQAGVGEKDEVKKDKVKEDKKNKEDNSEEYREIFEHWKSQESTVTHRKFKDSFKSAISARFEDGFSVEEIETAITNYDKVNRAVNTYWNYDAWSLKQFLSRDSGGHVETFLEKPKTYITDNSDEFKFDDELNKAGGNVKEIYNHWNKQETTISHRELKQSYTRAINKKLQDFSVGEIKEAISNLDMVNESEHTYWTYDGWSIKEFLMSDDGDNFEKFLDNPDSFLDEGEKFNGKASDEWDVIN